MRKFLFILILLPLALDARGGELLDRIIVTVNGNALLQSDWDEELHYEMFMSGRPISGITIQDRQNALGRIVDQELLREQMRAADFKTASPDEIDAQFALIRKQDEPEHAGRDWDARLQEYGLSDAEIRGHVRLELNQMRVIDARLRPSIQVNSSEVERYYREKIVALANGKQAVSFAESEPKIREILVQEKMNQFLDSWLESLRAQAKIQHFSPDTSSRATQP